MLNTEAGLNFYSGVVYRPPTTDADKDGIPDEWEGFYFPGDLGALGEGDLDNDGLNDDAERLIGANPTVADTDADGLTDGEEAAGGTDPANPDTDGEGLSDSEELDLGTDPTNADTDGDGLLDAFFGNRNWFDEGIPDMNDSTLRNHIYINDGSGSLESTPWWSSDSKFPTIGIEMADIDDDGDIDMLVTNEGHHLDGGGSWGGYLEYYENDGAF